MNFSTGVKTISPASGTRNGVLTVVRRNTGATFTNLVLKMDLTAAALMIQLVDYFLSSSPNQKLNN